MRSPADASLELIAITASDLEFLQSWKNAHRQFFFYQQEISLAQQHAWYAAYQQRPHDYMFTVRLACTPIGCMGIRLLEDGWDVYNVILGVPEHAGHGLMGRAFQLMLGFARDKQSLPINLKVLRKNPAIGWYQKNGFHILANGTDYLAMRHGSFNAN